MKAAVLPLPVMAQASTSWPAMAGRDRVPLDRGRLGEAEVSRPRKRRESRSKEAKVITS